MAHSSWDTLDIKHVHASQQLVAEELQMNESIAALSIY
jgi:hypothetical protein